MAQIKTYARLRPCKKAYSGYEINDNVLTVHMPENKDYLTLDQDQNFQSNISYDIQFEKIFDPPSTQEKVFDGVAKDIIQSFLNGYNGTIFAYGQTGTGKTYTVEGNACKYTSRGLATRALSMIYEELEKRRQDEQITVYLSYLEIYQEVAYDLLSVNTVRTNMSMAPFAKVKVIEGPHGSCVMPNLSLHIGGDEEVAQMLLFQGQANRKVAETPVNMRSSRSHAVFTVYLQARKNNSDVMVSSKLHLVDLAGSERVSKTGVEGQQLTEARSINLSLHHLETVIIALQSYKTDRNHSADQRGRDKGDNNPTASRSTSATQMSIRSGEPRAQPARYIPYRNSLLTMVLKDSLGGNCLTAMIATMSLKPENLGESISTCRFAQRVACIANYACRNEELDDKELIRQLKNKVAHLEKQVAALRSKGKMEAITDGSEGEGTLTETDRLACAKIMEGYIQGAVRDPVAAGICDQCRFRECLHLLRDRYLATNISQNKHLAITSSGQEGETLALTNRHHDGGDSVIYTQTSHKDQKKKKPGTAVRDGWVTEPMEPQSENNENSSSAAGQHHPVHPVYSGKRANHKGKAEDGEEKVEKKVDDISQLLQTITKSDKYKSPYERQREKEIRRLSRKLNHLEESQGQKAVEIEDIKKNSQVDELQTAETNLRLKLKVADDQVADQHAYLQQLRHIQADQELLEREVLVEKHLVKRQSKFQEKLKDVMASRERLESSLSKGSTEGSSEKKFSMEDKFGALRQGKGSLNTRQVFNMLKTEEKKMQKKLMLWKESDELDREKVMIKTKHLAMKEEATLEKLRDLKTMLKQSQSAGIPPGFLSNGHHPPSTSSVQTQHLLANQSKQSTSHHHDNLPTSYNVSQQIMMDHLLKNSQIDRTAGGYNDQNISCGYKELANSSNSSNNQDGVTLTVTKSMHDPHPSHKFSAVEGEKCVPAGRPQKSGPEVVDRNNNSWGKTSNSNNSNSLTNGWAKGSNQGSQQDWSSSHHDEDLKVSDLVSEVADKKVKDSTGASSYTRHSEEARFTSSYVRENIRTNANTVQPSLPTGSTSPPLVSTSTVLPSEYINSMSNKEQFDARKMGLSSRTFDSALSYMLDNSAPDSQEYDKYARTSASTSSPYRQRLERSHIKVPSQNSRLSSQLRKPRSVKPADSQSTWGPDTKSISIADRLQSFLETDSTTRKEDSVQDKPPKARRGKKSPGKDAFLAKLSECQSDNYSSDDDSFFGSKAEKSPLTALSEAARERTVVTRGQAERERIAKIRRAQDAATRIQRCWKRFHSKRSRHR